VLTATGIDGADTFQFNFASETGGRYLIEQSTDLTIWTSWLTITNSQGTLLLADESAKINPYVFFRARSIR
jgi:hypothetical protein